MKLSLGIVAICLFATTLMGQNNMTQYNPDDCPNPTNCQIPDSGTQIDPLSSASDEDALAAEPHLCKDKNDPKCGTLPGDGDQRKLLITDLIDMDIDAVIPGQLANNVDAFNNAQRAAVAAAVKRAIAKLKTSSTCSALLGPAAADELNRNSYNGFWSPNRGDVATAQSGAININVNGYFFGGGTLDWAVVDGVSLPDYQTITMLHEVGHEVAGLAPDKDDPGASMINTIQVTVHCGPWVTGGQK